MIMASQDPQKSPPPQYDTSLLDPNQPSFVQMGAGQPMPYNVQIQQVHPISAQMTGVVDPHLLMQQHAYNLNTQLLPPQQFTSPQQQFLPPGQPLFLPPHQQFSPALQLQQHIAMQAVNGGGQQFKNATPLAVLGQGAAPADCPLCGHRAMTVVNTQIGNTTHAWGLGICLLFCLGCIPYLMTSTHDVRHNCGSCGAQLATWHRSGRTVVHAHS